MATRLPAARPGWRLGAHLGGLCARAAAVAALVLLAAGPAAAQQIREWQIGRGGFGYQTWREPVANEAALPLLGTAGECRALVEEGGNCCWSTDADDWACGSAAGAPEAHAASHQNGGSDEIGVAGLSGLLADAQTPLSHDHGAVHSGLLDDDHTQYALLPGRPGGQMLIGGSESGDDLTLQANLLGALGSGVLWMQAGTGELTVRGGATASTILLGWDSPTAGVTPADRLSLGRSGNDVVLSAVTDGIVVQQADAQAGMYATNDFAGLYSSDGGLDIETTQANFYGVPLRSGGVDVCLENGTNCGPPAAHASSHAAAQSDPILLANGVAEGNLPACTAGTVGQEAYTRDANGDGTYDDPLSWICILDEGGFWYWEDVHPADHAETHESGGGDELSAWLRATDGVNLPCSPGSIRHNVAGAAGTALLTWCNTTGDGWVDQDGRYVNEGAAATTGDSATAFFSSGTIETARLGSGTANSTTYLRGDQTWATVSGGVSDHGGLTGLTDDDHSQYALLAGRSGGQTLTGGTASGDDLLLRSTSHTLNDQIQIECSTYTTGAFCPALYVDKTGATAGLQIRQAGSSTNFTDIVLRSLVGHNNGGTETKFRLGSTTWDIASDLEVAWYDATSLAAGTHSVFLGRRDYGALYLRSTNFSATGDSIATWRTFRNVTTDATQTELYQRVNTSTRLTVASDRTVSFVCTVVARRTDADNESAGYELRGVIDNNAGTTALVGSVTQTVLAEDTAAWDATAEADNTNDALVIKVTGEAAKTIRWVATCHTAEVTG